MAKSRGGDVRQYLISGREFDPVGGSSPTIMLSGFTNENLPTGNGKLHTVSRRKLGGFDGAVISLDSTRKDQEFIQNLINDGENFTVSLTLASGITYSGSGKIEGELNFNSNDGQLEFAFRSEKFEQI
jgi:hypothetical protein